LISGVFPPYFRRFCSTGIPASCSNNDMYLSLCQRVLPKPCGGCCFTFLVYSSATRIPSICGCSVLFPFLLPPVCPPLRVGPRLVEFVVLIFLNDDRRPCRSPTWTVAFSFRCFWQFPLCCPHGALDKDLIRLDFFRHLPSPFAPHSLPLFLTVVLRISQSIQVTLSPAFSLTFPLRLTLIWTHTAWEELLSREATGNTCIGGKNRKLFFLGYTSFPHVFFDFSLRWLYT